MPLSAGWSYSIVTSGMPSGDPLPAVACAAPLQTANAADDQRGLHTLSECTSLLLPGELPLLPGSLQFSRVHYQISEACRVSAVPEILYCRRAKFKL